MILNLISGPRNVSTALMYSFAQREETRVADEPFYGVYLARSGVSHPGRDEILKAMPSEERKVRSQLSSPSLKSVLFVKNMAHHMEVLEDPFIEGARNIFLIRDPQKILASYSEVIGQPVMRDIGIAYQYELFVKLQARGADPLVMDSGFLLQNPERVLQQLCLRCDLPYDQRMAHWPPGPKHYDGIWAQHWYKNVHSSTGFEKQVTTSRPLHVRLQGLLHEALPFYEKLLPFSLKA